MNYTEELAKARLKKKHDCRVSGTQIAVLRNKVVNKEWQTIDNPEKHHDLGNRSWGVIDFLVSCCGYRVRYVSTFDK